MGWEEASLGEGRRSSARRRVGGEVIASDGGGRTATIQPGKRATGDKHEGRAAEAARLCRGQVANKRKGGESTSRGRVTRGADVHKQR